MRLMHLTVPLLLASAAALASPASQTLGTFRGTRTVRQISSAGSCGGGACQSHDLDRDVSAKFTFSRQGNLLRITEIKPGAKPWSRPFDQTFLITHEDASANGILTLSYERPPAGSPLAQQNLRAFALPRWMRFLGGYQGFEGKGTLQLRTGDGAGVTWNNSGSGTLRVLWKGGIATRWTESFEGHPDVPGR